MERTTPCEPLVACAWRLIIHMVDAKAVKRYMKVINALLHACRLVCTDTYVKKMIVVVERLRVHFCVATVARATS